MIAAYVTDERNGGRARTVRDFLTEFAGLSGSGKQKAVTEAAQLSGTWLHDLVDGQEISTEKAERLLGAMMIHSRAIKPSALGVLGQEFLASAMAGMGVVVDSIQYRKIEGESSGVPFVLEVAFGVDEDDSATRQIITGLNWSPALDTPDDLLDLLGEMRVDDIDPVWVLLHLASPRLEFTDRGKGRLALTAEVSAALEKCVKAVTSRWKQQKRQADRNDRLSQRALEELRRANRAKVLSIKKAAYQVMEQSYLDASAGGRLPANARQIMYSARPLVQQLTDGRLWKESSFFTQHLLPDFIEQYPELTSSWNVVFDARGHFIEPHTSRRVDLGTLGVRDYVNDWHEGFPALPEILLDSLCPTSGPENRYKNVLFVEKEGFDELWKSVRLTDRYDLAIMSTKGMSVTASRELVEKLSEREVRIFVLHDFDKSGFSIVHTLKTDTRRYRFKTKPKVIDLGLRLADVKELSLQSEVVTYNCKVDPRENLRASGATKKECDFLVRGGSEGWGWQGERVELNAFGSARLVEWLEAKLQAVGVAKVIPGDVVLSESYRRAVKIARIQSLINQTLEEDEREIEVPAYLAALVSAKIQGTSLAWDNAVADLANRDVNDG